LFVLLALAGCGASNSGVSTFTNPTKAMEPAYGIGAKLAVDENAFEHSAPASGDVVIFHPPSGAEAKHLNQVCGAPHPPTESCPTSTGVPVRSEAFIKRIVAGPGDTVAIRRGYALVNGKVDRAVKIQPCSNALCNLPRAITVPPGQYFLLGDNRGASFDSRSWGPVNRQWIVARVQGPA